MTLNGRLQPTGALDLCLGVPSSGSKMATWQRLCVAPSFKNKTKYTPYVCLGIQFTHMVTNEGVISKTMPLLHSA